MSLEKRTRREMIKYLRELSREFNRKAEKNKDMFFQGKADAYEIAAFEIERNME